MMLFLFLKALGPLAALGLCIEKHGEIHAAGQVLDEGRNLRDAAILLVTDFSFCGFD
jgi:hypothetical protein